MTHVGIAAAPAGCGADRLFRDDAPEEPARDGAFRRVDTAASRYSGAMDDITAVLDFWFGTLTAAGEVEPEVRQRWWRKDEAFDASIRERFGALYERAVAGELDDWSNTAEGRLALVLVLDQFSRNLFRNSPLAWAHDARAQALTLEGLERGHDRALPVHGRTFLYMPLMHAEDRELQAECVRRFAALLDETHGPVREVVRGNLEFALRHEEIIERFGRFPHRNVVLGRESTPEEIAFLKEPNSSF